MARALSHKARLTLALAAAATLLIAGIGLGLANEQARRAERVSELGLQAEILSASVTAALAFDDHQAAQEYIDALKINPQLRAGAIYDVDGILFAGFGDEPPPLRLAAWSGWTGDGLTVTRGVSEAGAGLGQVVLQAWPEPFSAMLRRQGGNALLVLMATLFLALLGGAYAALDRRAEELARANQALRLAALERDKAEEALVQAKKMEALGQLTGGIAHDFNNLLQAIAGSLDLISRRPDDRARVERLAGVGLQASERGRKLISQLLAFSRAPQVQLRTVVVRDLIENMSTLLSSTLGPLIKRDIRLESSLPVSADPVQLEMAILNLAVNARDVMPEGGTVTLVLRRREIEGDPELPPGEYLELCFCDTGPGMGPEVAARAFEPFFTTKGVGAGTGLGLAQVYAVARQAGGVARITSTPGEGTMVSLFLRRSDEAPVEEGAVAEDRTEPGLTDSKRILVVDDDLEVRSLLRESLESLGHDVDEAGDAASAIVRLERAVPDLMLVDFAMPVTNGAELALQVRGRWPSLPIVFASGYADVEEVEAALGPGAPLLRKPFTLLELSSAIDRATVRTSGRGK